MNFIEWKQIVDSIVQFYSLLECDDLPDENYYFNFSSGIPAQVMADIVLSNNMIIK